MISKFEDEIGIKLFDRKKKPVELTTEGKIIIDQLKSIIKSIHELEELTKEIKGEIKGNLSISVIPTIAPFLLPLFLHDFASKFPDLKIVVREETTGEIIRKIKSRDLDIGIVSTPIPDKDIEETHLYNEDSLIRFVKANKAGTLLPYLATTDLSINDKNNIRTFKKPVPYRSVGIITHRHFVKKKLLIHLKDEISNKLKTIPFNSKNNDGTMLPPI